MVVFAHAGYRSKYSWALPSLGFHSVNGALFLIDHKVAIIASSHLPHDVVSLHPSALTPHAILSLRNSSFPSASWDCIIPDIGGHPNIIGHLFDMKDLPAIFSTLIS